MVGHTVSITASATGRRESWKMSECHQATEAGYMTGVSVSGVVKKGLRSTWKPVPNVTATFALPASEAVIDAELCVMTV